MDISFNIAPASDYTGNASIAISMLYLVADSISPLPLLLRPNTLQKKGKATAIINMAQSNLIRSGKQLSLKYSTKNIRSLKALQITLLAALIKRPSRKP